MEDYEINKQKIKKCKNIAEELDIVKNRITNIIINTQEEIEELVKLNNDINVNLNFMKSINN
jgi:hypothetical protein